MHKSICLVLGTLLVVAPMAPSIAQQGPQAVADLPGKASAAQLAAFNADPASILANNPIGGARLTALVKALLLADPTLVDKLVALAASGSRAQANAIGSGLGQAAKDIARVDKPLSDRIGQKVAASPNGDLASGYGIGFGPATLATSLGGGGGGVGLTPGSGSGSGPSTSAFSSFGTSNNASFGTLSFGGASVSCTASVSPARSC